MNAWTRKRAAAIRAKLLSTPEHSDCRCHACAEAELYCELTAASDEARNEISAPECSHERLHESRHRLAALEKAIRLLEMPTGVLLTNGERDGLTKH